ncbi:hypothetical protein HT118_01895 [Escherichia coli]|nr:hypothetical protein [Escherichia coli]
MTDSIPSGYKPLTCDTLPGYLSSRLTPFMQNREGLPEEWKVSEVGGTET